MKDLQKELNEFNIARNAAKNVQADDFPKIKRTYTYRTTPIIKAHDLAL